MHELTLTPTQIETWVAGDAAPVDDALRGLGFDADRRAEALVLAASALAEPSHTGVLEIRQASGDVQVALAIGAAVVAVLERPGAPEQRSLIIGPPADLPRLIADLVDLGPRPHHPERGPVAVPADLLDTVTGAATGLDGADLADLQELLAGLVAREAIDALMGPEAVRWRLTLGAADDEDARLVVDVVDGDEGGLWALLPDADPTALLATPVTAGSIWLVVADAVRELGKPHDVAVSA